MTAAQAIRRARLAFAHHIEWSGGKIGTRAYRFGTAWLVAVSMRFPHRAYNALTIRAAQAR